MNLDPMADDDQFVDADASPLQCPHCGSTDIVRDIRLNLTAEVGSIGLNYRAIGFLRGTEPLMADLCRACGTVCRFHVKRTDRKWISS